MSLSPIPVLNLGLFKGSDRTFTLSISGISSLTGCTIVMNIRESVGGTPSITKSSTDDTQIKITDPANKQALIYFTPADTTSLPTKKYVYDMWITDSETKTKPVLTGYFWIQDVAPTVISQMRNILDEAGELQVLTVADEYILPSTLNELYTTRKRIRSVEGIWLLEDEEHIGTNYYNGGGFDSTKGRIWLGTALATTRNYVRVSYTWEAGISDDAINWHLSESQEFVKTYTGIDFEYGKTSTELQRAAEHMALARTIIGCILTINGANVAQMGYNFRLDEFEIQTKLWGEGMIAQALFGLYQEQFAYWIKAIGKRGYIYAATPINKKYSLNTLLSESGGN